VLVLAAVGVVALLDGFARGARADAEKVAGDDPAESGSIRQNQGPTGT